MKNNRNVWIGILTILIVGGFGYYLLIGRYIVANPGGSLGGGYVTGPMTLMGATNNAVSIPRTYSYSDATTTDAANTFSAGVQTGYLDGGVVVTQLVNTPGIPYVRLNMAVKAGTATSTLTIKPQFSENDSNWFNVHATSTDTTLVTATTTIDNFPPQIFVILPVRIATSTYSILFNTYGARYTRFLFKASDLLTDPNDGIQAWIQAVPIEPTTPR